MNTTHETRHAPAHVPIDVRGILKRAGADPDAPEGSQAWALARVGVAVDRLINRLDVCSHAMQEAAKQFRSRGDDGYADLCETHADAAALDVERFGGAA